MCDENLKSLWLAIIIYHTEPKTKNKDKNYKQLEMWANAQRDGRPAEYRWRPLFSAAVWLTPTY